MRNITTTDVHFVAREPPKYRVFSHPADAKARYNVEQAIKADGRHGASTNELAQFRLEACLSGYKPAIDQAWLLCDANDSIWRYKDKIKLTKGFVMPEEVNLRNGAIPRTITEFNAAKGEVFTKAQLKTAGGINRGLAQKQALKYPVWRYELGDEVLPRFVDAQWRKYNLSKTDTAMGFFIPADEPVEPEQRALVLDGVGYGKRSDLGGGWDLSNVARLVGVLNSGLEEAVKKAEA